MARYWVHSLFIGLSLGLMGCTLPPSVSAPPQPADVAPSPVTDSMPPNAVTTAPTQGQQLPISAIATIAGQAIQLEVANTPQEQAMGFMYRATIPDDRGMLFPFNPPRPVNFWMKNVVVPLDMIFLSRGKVTAIASSVPPCTATPCPTYGPSTAIDQVIELRGGRAQELGLQVGDQISIQFLPEKQAPTP